MTNDPVVVKVGTNVLADPAGVLDTGRVRSLAGQLYRLRAGGRRVVLVSSGAIGAGVGVLKLGRRPTDLPHLQACAAVGQPALMTLYQQALADFGVVPAQVLLTAADFDSRPRYLNARHTLLTLLEYGCLPVVNENDTVSVAEIKFGDNDHLAALVAGLIGARLLVLLTNVPGLFTADPRTDPAAELVPVVDRIDAAVSGLAAATKSGLGTGGMRSKLRAAKLATAAGCEVVMADGSRDGVLDEVREGRSVGTRFLPTGDPANARRRWLGAGIPKGTLHLDAGAVAAVTGGGRSLLAVGVTAVTGDFRKGDLVRLVGPTGEEVGRGLVNLSAADVDRTKGRSSAETGYPEVVHRDQLAPTG
jgi:glutamate 5-kinase